MKSKAKRTQAASAEVVTSAPAPMETPTVTEGITVEAVLYALLVLVAGALRVINLGAAPLTTHEAQQALAAFNGSSLPSGGSPLLFSFNQILFGLFGTSVGDAGPRLGVALIGTAMVLLPALYRKPIGRLGALAASAVMAVSPTLVFASRTLDGQIITAACALAALGFGLRYLETGQRRDLMASAISIGLGLTSSSGVVTLIMAVGLGVLVAVRWGATDQERSAVQLVRERRDHLRSAVLWGGVIFVLASTALLLRPDAISGVPELASTWLAKMRGDEVIGVVQVFQILLIYEPLIVFAGLAGVVIAILRVQAASIVLSVWSIAALIVALLQPGRQVLDLVLVLTPLALLAGQAIEQLIAALAKHGAWQIEGAFGLVAAPLAGYLAIVLSGYAVGNHLLGSAEVLGQTLTPLTSFIVLLGLVSLIVGALFGLAIGWRATLRAAAVSVIGLCVLISMGNVWSVTQLHAGDAHELLAGPEVTTVDVRDLVRAIQAESVRVTGQENQIPLKIMLPEDDAVLNWYLRDFQPAQLANSADGQAPVIITLAGVTPPAQPGQYIGARFVTRSTWSVSSLTDASTLRWLLYREADPPAPVQTLVVWVQIVQQ